MPFRRPISPLSLETVPALELEADDLLGSDDELDESARAAKRRKIEQLGESYLKGQPLFILSASLKGPFEDGWDNPWTKTRKPVASSKKTHRRRTHLLEETAIPETDPKRQKLPNVSDSKKERTRHHGSAAYSSPAVPEMNTDRFTRSESGVHHRQSGQASEARRQPKPRPNSVSRSSVPRSRERSVGIEPTSFLEEPGSKSWLKRDHRRMEISDIRTPNSPTIGRARKRDTSDVRPRTKLSGPKTMQETIRRRSPVTYMCSGALLNNEPSSASKLALDESSQPLSFRSVRHHSTPASGGAHDSSTTILQEGTQERVPDTFKRPRLSEYRQYSPSHLDRVESQAGAAQKDRSDKHGKQLSLHVVPPSSHLPEFEYRRAQNNKDTKHSSPRIAPPAKTDINGGGQPAVHASSKRKLSSSTESSIRSDQPKGSSEPPLRSNLRSDGAADAQAEARSPGPMPVSAVTTSTSRNAEITSTEAIQSAQVVPGIAGSRDQHVSLRSTNVPEHNTAEDDHDNDHQLSTQAALLLAQRSFQDDLATPEREVEAGPGTRPSSPWLHDEGNSRVSLGITPFHQLSTPNKDPSGEGPVTARREEYHAISTQCMIDAVTPFSFSSSKKSYAQPSTSKRVRTSAQAKKASFAMSPPGPPSRASPSLTAGAQPGPPPEDLKAESHVKTEAPVEHVPCIAPRNSQSESQLTALPFTLSGSTPTTAQQDGQGPAMDVGTFDLSQAIEDAGSWLQQSWDVNRDIQQFSSKSAASSSSQANRTAVGIDAVR
ncbi:Vacuolar protein sorting-associated protein 11 [Paecilomyces lecythidis]|uniref:Vacuolar protein sorting-associated protein 11 n=1 Tax=Paecilomyces lecythidis TaxID=3004212 RepID=A0ABR3YAM7_9EURO